MCIVNFQPTFWLQVSRPFKEKLSPLLSVTQLGALGLVTIHHMMGLYGGILWLLSVGVRYGLVSCCLISMDGSDPDVSKCQLHVTLIIIEH